MEKDEYTRMYRMETDFWWYRTLHALVDSTIQQWLKRKTSTGDSRIPSGKHPSESTQNKSITGEDLKPQKKESGKELKIFDAGCGTGRMMEILQKYGTVYGIDYSEDAVRYSKERGLDNVEIGDLNDFNPAKEEFDMVVCLDVLYHAGIKDDMAVAGRLFRSLKPDGIMIINLPAFEYLRRSHDKVVHTRKRYRKREFVNQLRDLGFRVLKSSYRLPHLYFIILLSKIFSRGENKSNYKSDLNELPGWLNTLLSFTGRIENYLILNGFSMQVGSSLFVVAKK